MPEIVGEIVTLIIMAFALGMDAFSISLGMGMYQLRLREIFKIGIRLEFFIFLCRFLESSQVGFYRINLVISLHILVRPYC